MNSDLKKVRCRVDGYLGNTSLLSRVDTDDMTERAVEFLKRNGIDAEVMQPSMKGGGGHTFWEIIKQLWQHKQIFSILIAAIKYARTLYLAWLYKRTVTAKPTFQVTLVVSSDKILLAPIEELFCALEVAGEGLTDWLASEYPLLDFNRKVVFNLWAYEYRLVATTLAGDDTKYNRLRILRWLAKAKIKNAVEEWLSFASFGRLLRIVEFKAKGDFGKTLRMRKEYYYLSSRSVGDMVRNYGVHVVDAPKGGRIYTLSRPKALHGKKGEG